ncbi:hypothetical protein P8452_09784 [Trifolium repens]|nr:hypothetical protein P8452_09784 [Trifolium repens]
MGNSFKDVVLGGNKGNTNNQKGWVVKNKDKGRKKLTDAEYKAGIMAIDAEPKMMKKLEGSYVGTLQQIANVECIQTTLWMEGFQQITATPMGMDLILLSSHVEGEIQRAYESNKAWWERWFLSLTPWRPMIRPRGRRIWVRLFGVPLHIWSWEGFKKLIWRYGTLLNLDPETLDQSRFDVARALITVNYWEMVDEIIEVKIDDEVFIIRMIEERFGSVDLGRHKDAGSRIRVGKSEADSVSKIREDRSVLGVEEGWSENGSVSGDSVNNDEGEAPDAIGTAVNNQGSVEKPVNTVSHVEREDDYQVVGGKEAAKGVESEKAGTDGVMGDNNIASSGSVCSVVMETPLGKAQNMEGGYQSMDNDREVGEKVVLGGVKGVVGEDIRGVGEYIGPNSNMGSSECVDLLGQRKGKEIIVYEENKKIKTTLKGSTSLWASKEVGLGMTILIDENTEVTTLKDKDVALLAEAEKRGESIDRIKKSKEGGFKKVPLFFGPNKWANFSKAHKSHGGKNKKQSRRKRKEGGKGRRAAISVEDSQGDDIQNDCSDTYGDVSTGAARQLLPISNIQIVLNEGQENRPMDDNLINVRVEAERLFHIGLNLGITSNEERLGILDRMVDLERRDERFFEEEGGDEVVR